MPQLQREVPAQATAGTVQDHVIGEAESGGTVTEVTLVPEANVTANATAYRTFRVLNKGPAGAGTTVVASLALDTPTTDDLAAFDEKTVPLSATAADLNLTAGDVLIADETVTGAGVAHGGYTIKVLWQAK